MAIIIVSQYALLCHLLGRTRSLVAMSECVPQELVESMVLMLTKRRVMPVVGGQEASVSPKPLLAVVLSHQLFQLVVDPVHICCQLTHSVPLLIILRKLFFQLVTFPQLTLQLPQFVLSHFTVTNVSSLMR